MSKLVQIKTKVKITDLALLKEAVLATGVPQGELLEGTNMSFSGFGGAKANADLIVKQTWTKGYSPLGFTRTDEGYIASVDHLDDRNIMCRLGLQGNSYVGYVSQWYTALQAKRALKRDGFSAKVKVEGTQVVVLASR